MGKIVMSGPQNVSLDGVVQDPDGQEGFRLGGWFVQFGGKDLEEWNKVALDEALRAEAWLLGRRSYEFFGARWRPRTGELADRLNSMPKYVVSSTLDDPEWNNTTVLKGDVVTRGLEAEAGARRRNRRPCQLSARPHAARARPGRRSAAGRLPGRARVRRAPLRRDQRQEAYAPRQREHHRRRPRVRHLRGREGRLTTARGNYRDAGQPRPSGHRTPLGRSRRWGGTLSGPDLTTQNPATEPTQTTAS